MTPTADSFTPGEVALRLSISTRAVLRAIRRGELRAYHFGPRTIRVSLSDLEAWVARCRSRAAVTVSDATCR